jgi:predicted cupin superfamily sugar epimerase
MPPGSRPTADQVIAQLGLQPLPGEGGYFRQTWISDAHCAHGRPASSAIWFLLTPRDFSAWHRLATSEELWHFHAGDPVEHAMLDPHSRTLQVNVLGADVVGGELPRLAVPHGAWQGARLRPGSIAHGWSLLGCTVTPAWDPGDFELGSRATLAREFPGAAEWIRSLTR